MLFEVLPIISVVHLCVSSGFSELRITAWFSTKFSFCLFPVWLIVSLILGPKWRQCSPLCGGLDGHRDHPLLFLHLQPAQPPALPHQMGEVKLLRDYCLAFIWLKSIFYVLRSSNFHRYTFFFVLYPMGVAGELLTIYAALPYVQKTGLYSITLPNNYNFSFDYHTFLILVMISYIPCTF